MKRNEWRQWRGAGPASRQVLGAALLLLCAAGFAAAARAQSLTPTLSNPWIRLVMAGHPAAGYFTLSNGRDTTLTLIGADSPACDALMLHQSVQQNGQETMVMVQQVAIPPHGKVAFAPGGYHLMCMEPTKDVVVGKSIPITLRFADGEDLTADFPIKGATGK